MTLKVISAEAIVFEGEVTSVSLPGADGAFTVLQNHASLISTLNPGLIVYTAGDGKHEVDISGGIVDVDSNVVSVCIF